MSLQGRDLAIAALLAGGAFVGAFALLRPADTEPGPEPAPELQTELALSPDQAALSVAFLKPDGQPVPCAATLWRVVPGGRRMGANSSQRCDEQGRLSWTELEADTWRLMVSGPGVVLYDQTLTLAGGELWDGGTVQLEPGGNVAGVVTDGGEPVIGAEVRVTGGRSETTTAGGRYRFYGLPLGEIEVRAGMDDKGGGGFVFVHEGQVSELDIELVRVPPRGVLGIRLEQESLGVIVAEVHPRGPAAERVRAGDLVVAVDGQEVLSSPLDHVRELARGLPGEEVTLTVERQGERLEHTLARVSLTELQ